MRRTLLVLLLVDLACAPAVAEGTVLAVPAVDLAEHHVDAEFDLAVPAQDLAAQRQGPRPAATLVVPVRGRTSNSVTLRDK
jgi:hypothetical protein